MDQYRQGLLSICEHNYVTDEIEKARQRRLLAQMRTPSIFVCENPSNLIEPIKLGEKYAHDSCVHEDKLKYVWAGQLLDTKKQPFTIESTAKPTKAFEAPRAQEFELPKSIIPNLIIRNRPGVSLPPLDIEENRVSFGLFSNGKQEEPPQAAAAKVPRTPKTTGSFTGKKLSHPPAEPEPKHPVVPVRKQRKTMQKPKKKKQVHRVPEIEYTESKPLGPAKSPQGKSVTWSAHISPEIPAQEEEPQETLERHRTPSYLAISKSPTEKSLEDLEKLVEEQQKFLQEQGVTSLQSSSSERYHKTYEELEQEINNIKQMLSEREENGDLVLAEEDSPGQLEYSPDEAPEEPSFEEWLSPRFPESAK